MKEQKQQPKVDPPAHLSERAQGIWREVVPRRARSPERLVLLQVALEALDRADAARRAIDEEGLTRITRTTGAVHMHPLTKVEADARRLFASLWHDLALQWDSSLDGQYRGA